MTAQCCDLQPGQALQCGQALKGGQAQLSGRWTPLRVVRSIGDAAERMYNLKTRRAELLGRAVALNSQRPCDE